MDNRCKAHIVSQTHWDREWYLNSKYTNEWMVPFFKNLFVMLKKESEYIFVLNGQMANLYPEPHLHSTISSESSVDGNYDTRDER